MDTIAVKPSTIRIRERCDELTRTAVLEDGCAQWVGAEVRGNDERWEVVHAPIDASLYSGTAGIAAVLSRVDADRYGELSRWAARQAVAGWHRLPADGAFAGRAGAALAVSRVGARLGDTQLVAASLAALEQLAPHRSESLAGDLIVGAAGTVLALSAAIADGAAWLTHDAVALGDLVVGAARRTPAGLSWAEPGEDALCGLAHGASGAALALVELWSVTRHDRFAEAALDAVRFERAWFEEVGVWPDLRHPHATRAEAREHAASMWCHGAVGCGLVRLRMAELLDDDACRAEAGAAVRQAVADAQRAFASGRGAARGLTVCHGLGGTVDLLMEAARVLREPAHAEAAELLVTMAIDEIGADEWPSGVNGGGWAPGVMQGVAGEIAVLHRVSGESDSPSWWP
ncbi:MAG: lanthionine synthetase LanC family protein [Actinomycetota bacterium]|nr:lanthionine synthetase LanC family protein [Actinomycetota bacterium]